MTELKPCPFCGGVVRIVSRGDYFSITRGLEKGRCTCRVFMESNKFRDNESKEEAREKLIEKWNDRPNPWHTGIPTEDGLYIFFHHAWGNENKPLVYSCVKRKDGEWIDPLGGNLPFRPYTPIAWQKIEPYEASK